MSNLAPVLEDIQSSADERQIPINKVGIKGIRHPALVKDRSGGEQRTIADFSLYVSLPQHFKGTHMSRFVEILNEQEKEITVRSFHEMLFKISERLEAESSHVEMHFPYFIEKSAPVSGVKSLMDYDISFLGELNEEELAVSIKVAVPATSLCPCSKGISEYGAHNQRSMITVTARIDGFIWIEELIDLIEGQASCDLYSVLKRPDEKYVTEKAYDNPKFVEDIVRDIASRLNAEERITAYSVESENFESIHNHSAYALITRDKSLPTSTF
ncbi:GTP cyclohydrolase FolE2 [Sedimenticola thiotaurini]|uniref:GTP cyclohydrolase FolE2 n=1 Tax=Sedimenticola thiotaurini TaxID=1543721 RepID=A0A0F7JRZ3_9GAMM|nr:GTP cyclohydrolase FolE2 [Sedimenticola thiotaurini]AKH19246.1 GTP cyclohydrolase [Sedimenticola thiotaurini]